ncbi:MAG: hypothetical protein R3D51_16460 [Hyphomicrobiaceae bacterium]
MDRRTFIVTASAATAATCIGSVCALAKPAALARRAERLVLACPAPENTGGLFDDARLLARALERTLQEHSAAAQVKIEVVPGPAASIAALADGHADLFYGPEHANSAHIPALGFVAGVPGHLALNAQGLRIFMQGTGADLWRSSLASYGVVPIYAGHRGESPTLWSRVRIDNLKGLKIATEGLNAQVVAGLGGLPKSLKPEDITPALAAGEIDAAEIATLTDALALGLPKIAGFAARAPIADHAGAMSLAMSDRTWRTLSSQAQSSILSCVQAHAQARETRDANSKMVLEDALSRAHGAVFYACGDAQHVRRVSEAVTAELAAKCDQTRQFSDAYMAAWHLRG